jgi:hypothetical protein
MWQQLQQLLRSRRQLPDLAGRRHFADPSAIRAHWGHPVEGIWTQI